MNALLAGLALGLGSGITPGPLLALVVTTTLQRGLAAGAQVAASPLITDALVIGLSVVVLHDMPATVLAALSIGGAALLVWFAAETFGQARTADPTQVPESAAGSAPLRRGAMVNLVSPSPWLFWMTIGGPILVSSWRSDPSTALAWLVGFYLALIGSKLVLAAAIAAGRHRLTARGYRRLLAASAVLLLLIAGVLLTEAVSALRAGG